MRARSSGQVSFAIAVFDREGVEKDVDVVSLSQTEKPSRVYLETQASGKPLLASDIRGARGHRRRRTGCLFRVGDVDALANQTLRLARDRELRERIGVNARAVRAHSLTDVVAACEAALGGCVHAERVGWAEVTYLAADR